MKNLRSPFLVACLCILAVSSARAQELEESEAAQEINLSQQVQETTEGNATETTDAEKKPKAWLWWTIGSAATVVASSNSQGTGAGRTNLQPTQPTDQPAARKITCYAQRKWCDPGFQSQIKQIAAVASIPSSQTSRVFILDSAIRNHAAHVEKAYQSVASRPNVFGRYVSNPCFLFLCPGDDYDWLTDSSAHTRLHGQKVVINYSQALYSDPYRASRLFHTVRGASDWVLVASAGNEGEWNPVSLLHAGAESGYFVSVIAVEYTQKLDYYRATTWSNACGQAMDYCIAAPAAAPTGFGGTSASAPLVSAILDTVWAVFPDLSAPQLTSILFACAGDLGSAGVDNVYGHGLADLGCMLTPNGNLVALNTLLPVRGALALPQTLGKYSWGKAGDGTGREWDISPTFLDTSGRYFASIHPYEIKASENTTLGVAGDRLAVRTDLGNLSVELISEQGAFRGISGTQDFAVQRGEAVGVGLHKQRYTWRFSAMAYSGQGKAATQSLSLSGQWVQLSASYAGNHQQFSLVLDSGTRLHLRIASQARQVQLQPALAVRYRLGF